MDMLNKPTEDRKIGNLMGRATQYGVCIDRTTKPARIFGMEELILESDQDLFRFFSGIAERCTLGTGLNQYSSRSHCIVSLTLYCYDSTDDTVSTSRFQFVDLAGSEKNERCPWRFRLPFVNRVSARNVGELLVNNAWPSCS